MEKTIVNQNSTIMALQEDLELKEKCIVDLQDELTKKSQLIDQMEETILAQNDLIENVQKDVQEKNKCLTVLEEELKQKLQENEALKKQVSTLNENIINLNGVIEQNNHWHIEMKKEFDAQSANAIEREERLRLDYDQQVEKVKKDLGLITERKSMLETFLEKQVVYLLKRLQDFSEGRIPLDFSIGVFQKLFNEELEQLRLSHTLYSESSQSESFIRDLEELNKKLTACFSLEESLQIELQSKCKELQNVENELSETRKAYGALLSKERDTFSKLTQVELELNTLKCEKNQLQQHLAEANNNYEKVTVDFNRDRLEIEKKFKQILDNYETDLAILNKSLQELLHSIPSSFEIKDDNSTESEESSSTYLSPDIHSMISNPNIFNAQKIVSKCLHEIRKHNNNVKKSWLECQTLRLAIDVRNKALEEKDKQLTKVNDEIQLLKTKLDGIEDEKKYIHNKLNYVEGENVSYQLNIQSLNAKISDANETLKKYEDEINSLKQKEQSLLTEYAVCKKCNRSSLSPIMFDKKKVSCGSDSELLVRGGANTPDLSFQSLVDTGNRSPNIYTSTPFHRHNICDLEGGGEMSGPKPFKNQQELQLSLLKWMEKCHKLDSENKSLMLKMEDLELLNQDLKYSMNSVKEDMNTFEEKQINLEKRLNSFVLLKKETVSLSDEINLKDLTINHLLKDLEYLKCENVELFNNNLELEEKHRINLAKLSETKHVQHISGFGNTVTNVFNEKIKEIISLKGEINFLTNEKKCLSRKIELLLESNNTYVAKLNTVVEKLCYCEEELEKLNNEKLELMSSNKVLNKECQLLKIRVDYLSTLRDNHWCNPSSLSIINEMQREVLIVFKTALENKMESTHFSVKDSEKNIEKIDSFNLPEVLKLLNQQLNDEKLDFEEKVNEFRHIIQSAQEQNVIGDHWIVQVDKLLRNIIEEMKYHKEQYFRIEEALRSTGKFHDELQKQKGELRIKEHEMNSFQKKFEEEKLKSKKSELHLKILEQEIQEKNELIKMLMDQKDTHERNITELQKRLSEAELKYDIDLKTAEWKNRVVELKSYRHEVDNKLQSIKDIECLENKEDIFSMELEEAEKHYIEALEEVKAFFKAESSTNIAQIQEEHKEQV